MENLFPVQQVNGVDCVDSRLIAQDLGIQHSSFVKILKKYQGKIEVKFGRVGFQIEPSKTKGGVQNVTLAYLNEGQAIAAATLSRNTERVVDVKLKLTDSFLKAKQLLRQPPEPKILPTKLELAKELVLALEQAEKDKPKVEYFDKVLTAQNSFPITFIAKELGMSAIKLNKLLMQLRVQYKKNDDWFLYAKYQDKGYTDTYTYTYENKRGDVFTRHKLNWTEAGRQFIHNLLTHI